MSNLISLQSTTDQSNNYAVNDVDSASSTETYIGQVTHNGKWIIFKITTSGTLTAVSYANLSNNALFDTYLLAWADRTTLTYDRYENLTGA